MKKKDLVNELAKVTQTKKQAAEAMEIFLGTIKKTLKKRDKIYLSGFGTFSIVKRKARIGRNPKTGEAVKIAAKFIPKFKPARAFKEAVQ
jgi:nucleoid DNA-binding protein